MTVVQTKRFKCFFKSNLKHLKKDAGLTQQDLASIFEVSRNKVATWFMRDSVIPNHEDLKIISEYFRVSIDDLLYTDLQKELPKKDTSLAGSAQGKSDEDFLNSLLLRLVKTQEELIEIVKLKIGENYDRGNRKG